LKRHYFSAFPLKALSLTLGKLTLASLPMLALLYLAQQSFSYLPVTLQSLAYARALWISLLTLGVGGGLYVGLCHALGIREVEEVALSLKQRLLNTSSSPNKTT